MKQLLLRTALGLALLSSTIVAAEKPKTVIHVVTVQWKPGTTPEQIQKALGGIEAAAKLYPGIKNIWLRSIKVQGTPVGKCEDMTGVTHAAVMEFESEEALAKYADSPAQKAFYDVYIEHRGESRTHDITN